MARYINIHTKEIVEEHISGCKCKSKYAKLQDWKNMDSLSIDELRNLLSTTKVVYKLVTIIKRRLPQKWKIFLKKVLYK